MRVVLQRVSEASVTVNGEVTGQIGHGLVVLVGVSYGDLKEDADWIIKKICGTRIFADHENKMNLDIREVNGSILLVSQFTLLGSTKRGNRPSFTESANGVVAKPLYDYMVQKLGMELNQSIATGVFGADMKLSLVNDGPVTIIIDSPNKD